MPSKGWSTPPLRLRQMTAGTWTSWSTAPQPKAKRCVATLRWSPRSRARDRVSLKIAHRRKGGALPRTRLRRRPAPPVRPRNWGGRPLERRFHDTVPAPPGAPAVWERSPHWERSHAQAWARRLAVGGNPPACKGDKTRTTPRRGVMAPGISWQWVVRRWGLQGRGGGMPGHNAGRKSSRRARAWWIRGLKLNLTQQAWPKQLADGGTIHTQEVTKAVMRAVAAWQKPCNDHDPLANPRTRPPRRNSWRMSAHAARLSCRGPSPYVSKRCILHSGGANGMMSHACQSQQALGGRRWARFSQRGSAGGATWQGQGYGEGEKGNKRKREVGFHSVQVLVRQTKACVIRRIESRMLGTLEASAPAAAVIPVAGNNHGVKNPALPLKSGRQRDCRQAITDCQRLCRQLTPGQLVRPSRAPQPALCIAARRPIDLDDVVFVGRAGAVQPAFRDLPVAWKSALQQERCLCSVIVHVCASHNVTGWSQPYAWWPLVSVWVGSCTDLGNPLTCTMGAQYLVSKALPA